MGDPLYVQKGFGLKEEVRDILQTDYHSRVVDALRERGHRLHVGDVDVRLAREFGFCYGVDRAVDLAYETRRHFPERTIYITNEIIHNPYVNKRLVDLGVRFMDGGTHTIDDVHQGDVVIIPAFGVTSTALAQLRAKGCVLVDTTCGSVMNVWRRVKQYASEGLTSVIHGKYAHEETLATASKAVEHGGHYVVVLTKEEAQLVCDVVTRAPGALDRAAFLARFAKAVSRGFDPEVHLERVGLANQTTMLSTESLEIADMLKRAMLARHGEAELASRYRSFDTICSATQDRQDAMLELGRSTKLDVIIVIGGYNSSNTTHLVELGERFAPSFHIDGPHELLSARAIRHQPFGASARVVREDWLPAGPVTIGVTAGASTPNRTVGEVVERLFDLRGLRLESDQLPALSPQPSR